jgi:hypothetical protein
MALPTDILLVYGYLLIFAWVLVEQLGLPLPSRRCCWPPARSPPKDKSAFPWPSE